jgi:hypothetical protein
MAERPIKTPKRNQPKSKCPNLLHPCSNIFEKCPSVFGNCPSVYNKCLSVFGKCPIVYNRCPNVYNKCPSVYNKCPNVCRYVPRGLMRLAGLTYPLHYRSRPTNSSTEVQACVDHAPLPTCLRLPTCSFTFRSSSPNDSTNSTVMFVLN